MESTGNGTATRSVPPRCSTPVDWTATYTPAGPSANPRGGFTRATLFTTSPFVGSRRTSVASAPFATQTASVAAAMPTGLRPTVITSRTEAVFASIFDTVPSARFATHTAPAPAATAPG